MPTTVGGSERGKYRHIPTQPKEGASQEANPSEEAGTTESLRIYVANTCECYRTGRTFSSCPRSHQNLCGISDFHVGDRVKVNPHRGRSVDAVIKAVTTDQKGRVRLQVEFGKDKTAFVYNWQVCD